MVGNRVAIDLHSHTSASKDCLFHPAAMLRGARGRGVDVLAVTDHDVLHGARHARRIAKDHGLDVIVAEEVTTPEGEIIGLFLTEHVPTGPLDEVTDAIRNQGGLVLCQHPFDRFRKGSGWAGLNRADIVEVWNARTRVMAANDEALAAGKGRPQVACSDAHSPLEFGSAYSLAPMELPATPDRLLAALKDPEHVKRTNGLWIHLPTAIAKLRPKSWRLGPEAGR